MEPSFPWLCALLTTVLQLTLHWDQQCSNGLYTIYTSCEEGSHSRLLTPRSLAQSWRTLDVLCCVLNSDFYLASSHACSFLLPLSGTTAGAKSRGILTAPSPSYFLYPASIPTFYFLSESQTGLPLSTLDLTTALALFHLRDSNYLLKPELYLFPVSNPPISTQRLEINSSSYLKLHSHSESPPLLESTLEATTTLTFVSSSPYPKNSSESISQAKMLLLLILTWPAPPCYCLVKPPPLSCRTPLLSAQCLTVLSIIAINWNVRSVPWSGWLHLSSVCQNHQVLHISEYLFIIPQ